MFDLASAKLRRLFASINANSSEAEVEQRVIIPLLKLLGYAEEDWTDQVPLQRGRLDFFVQSKSKNFLPYPRYLVIEVKAPKKKKLENGLWQLKRYLRESGSILGILTNGFSFQIYYNYCDRIEEIARLSAADLIEDPETFGKLLCKTSCDRVMSTFDLSNRRIHTRLLQAVSRLFGNPRLLNVLAHEDEKQLEGDARRQRSMIITVFNNKGGVGKTTLTINLAAVLAQQGKKILLIDIDPQANLTTGLGTDPLFDVEREGRKDVTHLLIEAKTTIDEVIIKKRWGDFTMDFVPSHIRLSNMEPQLLSTIDIDNVLAKKLKKYKDKYDYIFIDPPPSFGKVNTIAMMASGGVLIPTQLSPYPIRALEYVIDRTFAVDDSRETPLHILGVAVSMYDRRATRLADDMKAQIYEILSQDPRRKSIELFPESTWIPNLTAVSKNPQKGYPLICAEFDPEIYASEKEAALDASHCYKQLAKHLELTLAKNEDG